VSSMTEKASVAKISIVAISASFHGNLN